MHVTDTSASDQSRDPVNSLSSQSRHHSSCLRVVRRKGRFGSDRDTPIRGAAVAAVNGSRAQAPAVLKWSNPALRPSVGNSQMQLKVRGSARAVRLRVVILTGPAGCSRDLRSLHRF